MENNIKFLSENCYNEWQDFKIDPAKIEKIIDSINKIGCTSFIINNKDIEYIKENSMSDVVNCPSHYCEGRQYEPIKVIQDWKLDFCLGNTVKYISRAGRKSSAAMSDIDKEIQDLEKARFYLNYRIDELKEAKRTKIFKDNLNKAIPDDIKVNKE